MLTMAGFESGDLAAARDAVKAYARVALDEEDALIADLAATALLLCEAFCGRIGIAREAVEIAAAASCWTPLSASPARAIGDVQGVHADGEAFALPVDAYAIDVDAEGLGWVRVTMPGGPTRVRVIYDAGLADGWDGLPEPLKQGAVRLATHLYQHRDDAREGPPPAAVAALWRPWRRVGL